MSTSDHQSPGTTGVDPANEPAKSGQEAASAIDADDPHKVEKLSKLGHADDEAAEGTE